MLSHGAADKKSSKYAKKKYSQKSGFPKIWILAYKKP